MKNDRTGVYVAGRIADNLAGVLFREQMSGVTGLDAHIEVLKNSYKFARALGVKIYNDAERGQDGFVCRGSMDNLVYWFQHSIPVLIMAYDDESKKIYWEHLRDDNISLSPEGWEITVPTTQEFYENALSAILKIPSYSPHLSRLAIDRPWMETIESGSARLILVAEENINRSAGRGMLQINVTSPRGEKQEIYDWVFASDPDVPFVYRFQELFPWAEIKVDKAFYDANSPDAGAQENLSEIRPWIVEAGEIAHFRLDMKLNDLGRAFLLAERFVCKGEYPENSLSGSFGALYEEGIKFRHV